MGNQKDIVPNPGNLSCTHILDCNDEAIRALASRLMPAANSQQIFVQTVHRHLVQTLRPVYSVDEWQSASVTLKRGRGSCSQRMACLEALARAAGIATRVHALWVKGEFWYPRFRLFRWFIPGEILLAWPQFLVDERLLDFDELHAPMSALATARQGFTNAGESLFEAIEHLPVDFQGKTCHLDCARPEHDLSRFVVRDGGWFDSRDEAFRAPGSFQFTLRGRLFEALYGGRKSS